MFKQYLAGANIKNKEKSKNYHTVGTFPKSNRKIVEKGKINTLSTQINDHSLSWLSTGTSIKSGEVKKSLMEPSSYFIE